MNKEKINDVPDQRQQNRPTPQTPHGENMRSGIKKEDPPARLPADKKISKKVNTVKAQPNTDSEIDLETEAASSIAPDELRKGFPPESSGSAAY